MKSVTNIGIQLFTYHKSWRVVSLLHAVEILLGNSGTTRLAWQDTDGARKSISLAKLLLSGDSATRFNACYARSSVPRPELRRIGINGVMVHLSVSPDCSLWLLAATSPKSGKAPNRMIRKNLEIAERCAAFLKPEIVPSVLEITLSCHPNSAESLARPVCSLTSRLCASIDKCECFGAIDFGGDWLFFPTTGMNPNAKTIEVYNNSLGGELPRSKWSEWKLRHNATLESSKTRDERPNPLVTVHSLEPRRPFGCRPVGR